jgi:broad specificity phosphatase PhoE
MTDAKRVDSDALSAVQLKKVDAPSGRPLPTAEEIAAAKALAEVEPEPIPKELLPKTGDGQTHLDLIKGGVTALKKVDGPAPRPLPTAEQIAAEKAASQDA